jgi:hypothetical protein
MVALNFNFVHRVRLDLRCYFAGNLADVVLGMDTLAEVVVRPWVSLSIHSFFLVCILFLEYCASASYVSFFLSFFLSRFSVTSWVWVLAPALSFYTPKKSSIELFGGHLTPKSHYFTFSV